MISNQELLSPIKTIIAEELPVFYAAQIEIVFGNLCEGQEDNFKLIIALSWSEKAAPLDRTREGAGTIDWSYRVTRRIHQMYGDGLIISLKFPATRA